MSDNAIFLVTVYVSDTDIYPNILYAWNTTERRTVLERITQCFFVVKHNLLSFNRFNFNFK